MRAFELFRPSSAEEATAKAGQDAAFKAAGVDLLDRMKERVYSPKTLIDLQPLAASMSMLTAENGTVTLGALVTLAQLAAAQELADPAYAALTEAAAVAATPQIRTRATLGGNLLQQARCWYLRNASFACAHSGRGHECLARTGENRYHAILGAVDCVRVHPSNVAPALMVLDAQVLVVGPEGATRNLPLRDLYPKAPLASAAEHTLAPNEIMLLTQLPPPQPGTRSAYRESREKQSFDWPTASAAVRLCLAGGKITAAAICLGAVAPVPWNAPDAAKLLVGEPPNDALFVKVAERAFAGAAPLRDNAYKVPIGKAVLVDALHQAATSR